MSLHPFFRFSMWALLIGSALDLINGASSELACTK